MKGAIDFTKRKGSILIRFSIPGVAVLLAGLFFLDILSPYGVCTEPESADFDAKLNCVIDWYRELEKATYDPDYEIDGTQPGHPDDH